MNSTQDGRESLQVGQEADAKKPRGKSRSVAWAVSLTASSASVDVLQDRTELVVETESYVDLDKGNASRFVVYASTAPSMLLRISDEVEVTEDPTRNWLEIASQDVLLQSEALPDADNGLPSFTLHDVHTGAEVVKFTSKKVSSACYECFTGTKTNMSVCDATGRLIGNLHKNESHFKGVSVEVEEANVVIFRAIPEALETSEDEQNPHQECFVVEQNKHPGLAIGRIVSTFSGHWRTLLSLRHPLPVKKVALLLGCALAVHEWYHKIWLPHHVADAQLGGAHLTPHQFLHYVANKTKNSNM
ncbi:unnamed protein product [Notodromas monacha]|uniref:Phospholipid scramblase n=1 Tax=Notodromas monacha TaxID=399045 RepID=A0A7R9BS55_9CRUS|nr:unnamed protein product [Notodromas monacha]CAG0919623.1 unnamed protein product [Notodromas monacha]